MPVTKLAQQIYESERIELSDSHSSGRIDLANAKQNIIDASAGLLARRSNYGLRPGVEKAPGGSVGLSESMLKGMLKLAETYTILVTEIAGGAHSNKSRHYVGVAFDVGMINGSSVNTSNTARAGFMAKAKQLGATQVLGPGDPQHGTHVHVAWPRPADVEQGDDLEPFCEGSGITA
jgi:hypothetical protein